MTRIAPERPDRAIARLLAGGLPARIRLDYNSRDRAGRVRAWFSDCDRIPAIGEHATVYEPEDGTEGDAVVTGINWDRCQVFLDVDWPSLREVTP